jgi:hypothetical protein
MIVDKKNENMNDIENNVDINVANSGINHS